MITQTASRMLQCLSILASVGSGNQGVEGQKKMERLVKTLKWNWLGKVRTGKQRGGFVGMKPLKMGLGAVGNGDGGVEVR